MYKRFPHGLLAFFLIFSIPDSRAIKAQTISGKIIRIIDGDQLLVDTPDSTFAVHLFGIDAPEKDQLYGPNTMAFLENFLWYPVRVELVPDINTPGHSGYVFLHRKNLNVFLVKNGYAWYKRPHTINAELAWAEEHAKKNKLGLWKNPTPAPPWEFRQGILPKPLPTDGTSQVLVCTRKEQSIFHKKYCSQLLRCHANILVIDRKQAEHLQLKACKDCFR